MFSCSWDDCAHACNKLLLENNPRMNIHGSWELGVYKVVEDQCGGENTFELLMVSPKLYPSMMLPQGKEELN